ncbi:Sporulation and spore germination [Desulfonispora thiosulfatigenes DSM 11270]|uniref:Sporulation and spore germination n=1 Tax=Desulfonispora thiosulfatigenes DSM 11270 TaxID=656914 RepID=A0A1W1V3C8_DESTI|nr:GerMN domain-containing protein [Desulfonispora thiosulfatigenes]SMB87897.1 Sporulation and spore germination [Desulfonispora thiosulfatigenes DSM 11270]
MRKYLVILLSLMLIFTLTACTNADKDPGDVEIEDQNDNDDIDLDKNEKKEEVTLYFANETYMETGDESLKKVIPLKRVIEYTDIPLEEAVVRAIMDDDDIDYDENSEPGVKDLDTAFPDSVKLNNVTVKDKTAMVNFKGEGLAGGSLQEILMIDQVVKTLLALDTVDKVQFLIDGQEAETLMGHIEISEPFTE